MRVRGLVISGHLMKNGWRRKWQPTPVFLPGKLHGQRSLGREREWDGAVQSMGLQTVGHDRVHTHTHTHTVRNGVFSYPPTLKKESRGVQFL